MIYKGDIKRDIELRIKLFNLFEDMKDTLILSCLQGHMGHVWVDDLKDPKVAQILVGIFVYYSGDVNSRVTDELLLNLPEHILAVVPNQAWKNRIESFHKDRLEKFQRYAFKKDISHLNHEDLRLSLAGLSKEYELKIIDQSIGNKTSFQELSEDLTGQFDSLDDFLERGFGYCILHKDEVVCAATSFSIYDDGIEIEVDTHVNYRRKGLATIAASALILHCLERGIYPNWDAANLESVHMAKKIGFIFDKEYDTYYINYKPD